MQTGPGLPRAPRPSARAIFFGSGPRFLRDGFGPILSFYLGWKALGLVAGIVLATVFALAAHRLARREERSGAMAALALGFVLVQAVIGLISNSATAYLAQPVLLNGALGLAFLGSAFTRTPIIGIFAAETYPFPEEIRSSRTFRDVFARCSLAWGIYQLVRAGIRLLVLTRTSVDAYVLVNLVTGFPMMSAMFAWSAWYSVRAFRRSEEWGWAFDDTATGDESSQPAVANTRQGGAIPSRTASTTRASQFLGT